MWNECSESGTALPTIAAQNAGDVSVTVDVRDGNSTITGGGCGQFIPTNWNPNTGRIIAGTAVVFTRRSDGSSCEPLEKTIAHEIGHALGLADSDCYDNHIMAPHSAQGDYREVQADECQFVGDNWTTSSEGAGGGGGGPAPEDPDECAGNPFCGCPLILDLNGDGIRTTDVSAPVLFDLNADGVAESITWTDATTEEAFLWIDVVMNGRVDSGAELFGIGTAMPSGGRAANGFVALVVYDHPAHGGNDDGKITLADAIWGRLRLWIDANHNGVSEMTEVGPIHAYGILSLDLAYYYDPEPDPAGNYHFLRGEYSRRRGNREAERLALDDVSFQRVP
jgi:Dual-action HEIGH metallo-peptidase